MSLPITTRYGRTPIVDEELANKAYVDAVALAVNFTDLIGTIALAQIPDVLITDAKIIGLAFAKLTGSIAIGQIPNLLITDAKIAALAATKLTGTIAQARIPLLDDDKIPDLLQQRFTNTTTTTYLGTASSFGTVGVGVRDIYIKKIDANNEGVFTKIWKNGAALEVQIA